MNKGSQSGLSGQKPAESVEQRGLAKGNAQRPPTARTQCPGMVSRGLLGVREAARRDRKLQFTALLHHIDIPLLRESYEALRRNAAPGVDGMTWAAYQEGSTQFCSQARDAVIAASAQTVCYRVAAARRRPHRKTPRRSRRPPPGRRSGKQVN